MDPARLKNSLISARYRTRSFGRASRILVKSLKTVLVYWNFRWHAACIKEVKLTKGCSADDKDDDDDCRLHYQSKYYCNSGNRTPETSECFPIVVEEDVLEFSLHTSVTPTTMNQS